MAKHFFSYPEGGAPFPGKCVMCGDFRDLFDAQFESVEGAGLLCRRCIKDLAIAIGYVDGPSANDVIEQLTEELHVSRETAKRVPNHVEELIDGIRNSVADFVLAISSGSDDSSSVPVQSSVDSAKAVADHLESAASDSKAPRKSASR